MPPKVEAGGGASATTAGLIAKRNDSLLLQAFLLSQSSILSGKTSKEKEAQFQELILQEQGWQNFKFLRESALFNTALFGRPSLQGNTLLAHNVIKGRVL